jgi:hypothetical protein
MKRAILKELVRGAKSDEELRRLLLGERPKRGVAIRRYDTKYVAFKRAIQDLVSTQKVTDALYTLGRDEVADVGFLATLLKRYSKVDDSRLEYVMEQVEFECRKFGAVWTDGLLEFLADMVNHKNPKVRGLAVSGIRCIVSTMRDVHNKNDRKTLEIIVEKFRPVISEIAMNEKSLHTRQDAINLLSELGTPESISVLAGIVRTEPKATFNQIYPQLKEALCLKYDEQNYRKDRLIRDYKSRVHEALLDLAQTKDAEVRRRGETLLWHFKTGGQSVPPGGEPY